MDYFRPQPPRELEFNTVGMGLRPTRAGMKMSYDAVVAPERAKVATVNGT